MRSWTLFAGALLACGTLLPIACGGTDDTGPSGPTLFDSEEGFCSLFANAICTNAVAEACYGSDAGSLADDLASCREQAARPEVCNPTGFAYNRVGAEGCLQAAQFAYADAKLTLDEVASVGEACAAVFNAGGPEGATCSFDAECNVTLGLGCVVKGGSGTCQIPEEVQPGFNCGEPSQTCADQAEDQFFCSDAEGACVQRAEAGQDCTAKPCYDNALCSNGTCTEKLGNGETCSNGAECLGGFCTIAAGGTTGTCSATLSLSPTTGNTCSPFLPPGGGTGGGTGTGTGGGGGTGGATGGAGGTGGSGGA